MPKQPALPGLRDAMKKKVTRREQFLAESEAQAPLVRAQRRTRWYLGAGCWRLSGRSIRRPDRRAADRRCRCRRCCGYISCKTGMR